MFPMNRLKTPVVLLVFKRPDTTKKVFEAIRSAKPSQLLLIADGPRCDRPEEVEKCAATRAIIDRVDWDCEVLKNYADTNLGCGKRVATGLDWVFENVEEAIILEDDCVPHPTFFRFCEELLERYRYDERIFSISGQNFQFGRNQTSDSYYFSHFNHSWGWASWRRAWKYFDFDMKCWPEVNQKNLLNSVLSDSKTVKDWTRIFQLTYENHANIWDYQWRLAMWMQSGLSVLPHVDLVSNIGFGKNSTNTKDEIVPITTQAIQFPLKHPSYLVRNLKADNYTQKTIFNYFSFYNRLSYRIKQIYQFYDKLSHKLANYFSGFKLFKTLT
jgi:hypothetical protein